MHVQHLMDLYSINIGRQIELVVMLYDDIHGSIEVIVLVARSKQQYRVSAERTRSSSIQEEQ